MFLGNNDSQTNVYRRTPASAIRAVLLLCVISGLTAAQDEGLQSESARIRAFAVRDLGEAGGPDAVPPLVSILGDENVFVRATAMQALYTLGKGELRGAVVEALMQALADPLSAVRAGAAETLGMLEERSAAAALTARLADSDPLTQHAAAAALGRLGEAQAVNALIALAGDDNAMPFPRMGALWALGELQAEDAVEPLLGIVLGGRRGQWNYTSVFVYAVEALGKINDPESVPGLVRALAIEDRHLRGQIEATLERMTGERLGQDPERWGAYLDAQPENHVRK